MKSLIARYFVTTLILGVLTSGESTAAADSVARHFGPFIGAGLSKNMASLTEPGVNDSSNGWGNGLQAGFDLPFSDSFGLFLEVEMNQIELRNKAQSATYLDDVKLNVRSGGGGLFFKSIYLGGSYQTGGADLQMISTTTGSSSAHFDLTGSSAFIGYTIVYHDILRENIEGRSTKMQTKGFGYNDYSVGLKFQILLGGLF